MSKINVVVAKMDRDEHYEAFLYYIDLISRGHDVRVYTTSCKDTGLMKAVGRSCANIKIDHKNVQLSKFNKAKLLNLSLLRMRQDYDMVCVFDIDMIYKYQFFSDAEKLIDRGYDYIVSYGFKVSEEQSKQLMDKIEFQFSCDDCDERRFKGCSQITLTKESIEVFKSYFGDKLYDEGYEGWGGEDSDLSFKSKVLDGVAAIKKTSLADVWFHLWHPENRPEGYRENDKNSLRFQDSKIRIIDTARAYGTGGVSVS